MEKSEIDFHGNLIQNTRLIYQIPKLTSHTTIHKIKGIFKIQPL